MRVAGSLPYLLCDDAHVAVAYKPAGVALTRADGVGPHRAGPPLNEWAAGSVAPSSEHDALLPPRPVSPLHRACGGLVPLAKTRRAEQLMLRDAESSAVRYVALTCGAEAASEASPSMQVLQTSQSPTHGRLALVLLAATAATPAEQVCRLHGVLGEPSTPSTAGGLHLALVGLSLPPSLAELRGAAAASCFTVEAPRKLAKTLRRERLHSKRREEAAASPSTTASSEEVAFMGFTLRVGSGHLRPRPSSVVLVHAAEAAVRSHDAPRLLDLGCGCGALLLAALARLPASASAVGLDLDEQALLLARRNADSVLGAPRAHAAVQLLNADFGRLHSPALRALLPSAGFHGILCNPPYLPAAASVGRTTSEAPRALFAGTSGLDAYAAIAASLALCDPPLLSPDGVLLLQLPASGGALRAVSELFARSNFHVGTALPDERGVARCLPIWRSDAVTLPEERGVARCLPIWRTSDAVTHDAS